MAAGRQLSKLSFVQFSDAAAVHKGPVGIKNGMMLLDSQSLAWADLGKLDQKSNFVQKFNQKPIKSPCLKRPGCPNPLKP